MTASPVPTFRTETTIYTTASATSRVAVPPATLRNLPSRNWIFCSGSCNRELLSSGRSAAISERSPMRADCSATRAARSAARAEWFVERTDAKVAIASTGVLTAVASYATVAHSVTATATFLNPVPGA
jgi:hypothetical protein